MATNIELGAQVRINNIHQRSDGTLIPKVLSIKASKLKAYIDQIRLEANRTYTPNEANKFKYLPLLMVRDLADTLEQVTYMTEDDLPKETVFNSKGVPILILLPEESSREIGVNIFDFLPRKKDKNKKDR